MYIHIGWLNNSKVNDLFNEADQFITPLAKYQTSFSHVKNEKLCAITGEGQTRGLVAICNILDNEN